MHPLWTARRRAFVLVLLLASGTVLGGCATSVQRAGARCTPAFPYRDGWLGGDAAYSVGLADGEMLWFFGDTFVGEPGATSRRGAHFIHNSIGRSRCDAGGTWSIDYHWGQGPDGPRDFFDRDEPGAWWWLFDGFVRDGDLYVGLLRVESSEPRGPLAMAFAFSGLDLARVSNPHDAVEDWNFERLQLSRSELALPASALVVDGDHLYLFTFLDRDARAYPRILARLPLASLDTDATDLGPSLETLARDGSWAPGLDPATARILMDDDATEMSVEYHPEFGAWLAVYSYPSIESGFPAQRPSDRVWVRTAPSLEGPWSPPRSIFRVPELDPSYAGGYDPYTACYAAKAHAELSAQGSLTLTYVCNLFAGPTGDPVEVLGRLADDMGLYRPIPASVTLPPDLLSPREAAP